MSPTLYSNGLLITNAFLDELSKRHMRPSIQFSFDGVGYHDWMRGVHGAEKVVLDALKRCQERGIPTSVSMVLFRENLGSIRETANLLASLGCSSLKTGRVICSCFKLSCTFSPFSMIITRTIVSKSRSLTIQASVML